jgi:hypothetical protein
VSCFAIAPCPGLPPYPRYHRLRARRRRRPNGRSPGDFGLPLMAAPCLHFGDTILNTTHSHLHLQAWCKDPGCASGSAVRRGLDESAQSRATQLTRVRAARSNRALRLSGCKPVARKPCGCSFFRCLFARRDDIRSRYCYHSSSPPGARGSPTVQRNAYVSFARGFDGLQPGSCERQARPRVSYCFASDQADHVYADAHALYDSIHLKAGYLF